MSYSDIRDQRRHERETEGYKMFMQVAKKISRIDYGKWTINIDPADPLRKFTLDRDIGYCTLKVRLIPVDTYHRGEYEYSKRYDAKMKIVVEGLYKDCTNNYDLLVHTDMQLRPRMAKKLIALINNKVIPMYYETIRLTAEKWELKHIEDQKFKAEIAKVNGLRVTKESYTTSYKGSLLNCPFSIICEQNSVQLHGTLTYDEFAKLAENMGWGK